MKFGVGVLGATGYIGTPYREEIRAAVDDASIVALCARRLELLQAAGAEDGAGLVTRDWREVVENDDVNLVIVATPDALHHEAVMRCAELGKHVVCEKPSGVNVAEAEQMWEAYRDAGLAHFVPYWTRYIPVFQRARQVYRSGRLGELRAVVYRWHNPRPSAMPFTWRDDAELSSAGSIADVGSHAYDALRWILNLEAQRVQAHAKVISPPKPDLGDVNLDEALKWGESHQVEQSQKVRAGTAVDYAAISFELPQGVVGALMLSHAPVIRKGLAPEVELHGTEASLAIDRLNGLITIAKAGGAFESEQVAQAVASENRFADFVFPALRAAIAGEPTDHPDLEDAYRVQRFTDAAAKSGSSGGWVDV